MRMLGKLLLGLVALFGLSGCEYTRVSFSSAFNVDDNSGIATKTRSALYLYDPKLEHGAVANADTLRLETIANPFRDDLRDALNDHCPSVKERKEAFGAAVSALSPILLSVGKLVIDEAVDAGASFIQSRVDAFYARSEKVYPAATLIIDKPKEFGARKQCLVLVRHHLIKEGDKETWRPTFAYVALIEPRGTVTDGRQHAFVMKAVYARMDKSTAITGDGKGVDVTAALSAVVIRLDPKSGPSRTDYSKNDAADDIRMGDLMFGKPRTDPIGVTKLLPLPDANASAIELRLAITEAGSGLSGDRKARTRAAGLIEAVKSGLKPQLTGALSTLLK